MLSTLQLLTVLGVHGLRAEVFVDADRAAALIAEGAAVLDARGTSDWRAGHLPGARPIGWKDLREGWGRSGLLESDVEVLGAALTKLGVDSSKPALVYGAAGDGWGEEGRIYWTLDHLGHDAVFILDGGVEAWTRSGRALESSSPAPPANPSAPFTPRPDPGERATLEEVSAWQSEPGVVLWDVREAREYAGQTPYGEARGGHIPGAKHLYWKALLAPDGTLLPEPQLRAVLEGAGLTADKTVVPMCTGGVRSGFAYAVLIDLGYPRVENYDGSMWQWSADPSRPLETAP